MLVSADGVSVTVGETPLLAPTSIRAGAAEVVALRGPNGSGKTTLLRVLAGIVPPTAGRVEIASEPVDQKSPTFRRRVASLIGLPPLARNLTLAEHLRLVGLSWGEPPESVNAAAQGLLDSFGLGALGSRFPHELSSGQTQLFALALTFARPSEVILLDEPEQRLDADRLARVRDSIRGVVAQGRTVVMATHSQWLAEETGTQTVTLVEAAAVDG
jgi:ABC-2 type transport system ATP-binding protein